MAASSREEGLGIQKVVGRESAGHRIEPIGRKRESFGVSDGSLRPIVLDCRCCDHFGREIRCDHLRDTPIGERSGDVVATGCDVEYPGCICHPVDKPIEIRPFTKYDTVSIPVRGVPKAARDIPFPVSVVRHGRYL